MANPEDTLKARRQKYGIMADCNLVVEGNIARITIDNPLPDNDRVVMELDVAKLIQLGAGSMGAFISNLGKPEFFDGK